MDVGRLAPIEVARAESLVTSTRLMLTQVIALRDQQEMILRTLLDPQSVRDAAGDVDEIVATDPVPAAASGDGVAAARTGETRVGNPSRRGCR
jgi:hypothetical protein